MKQQVVIIPPVLASLAHGAEFLDYYLNQGIAGGMFVPGHLDLALGTYVNVSVELAEENQTIDLRGTIRWKRVQDQPSFPAGVGVAFDAADIRTRDLLLELSKNSEAFILRRRAPRIPAIVPVDIIGANQTTTTTVNISAHGAFLKNQYDYSPGERIRLDVLPTNYSKRISLAAKIVWSRNDSSPGVGIQFAQPWYRPATGLRRLLASLGQIPAAKSTYY